MKKYISLLFVIPALLFGAAGDIKIDTKNSSDNAWISRIFAKANNQILVTDSSGVPALSGTGLTFASGTLTVGTNVSAPQLTSTIATGTAPFVVSSTTQVANLNVATAGASTNVGVTDDTTTNATMYPVWVTANTGNLPAKVTSTKMSFNPSTGRLTVSSLTDSALTSGRVPFAGTAGLIGDSANLTFVDGTTTGQLIAPVGAAGTPSYTFLGDTDTGMHSGGANNIRFVTNGTEMFQLTTSRAIIGSGVGSTATLEIQNGTVGQPAIRFANDGDNGIYYIGTNDWALSAGGTKAIEMTASLVTIPLAVNQGAKTTTYNNIATAGWGHPAVYAAGRATAQSAANSSISTYTVGAADGSFEVSANMNVTASTSLVTTLTCTYTDESNTARTMVFPVTQLSGSFIAAGAITGTGAWETPIMHIRCKASTAITILTSTGTFTGVTYTAEGIIKQTN